MGRRVASMVADTLLDSGRIRALICLGYPFHPPRKPEQLHTGHLVDLKTPTLVVQGTRDEFGSREEVLSYNLSPLIDILWLEDGDHDLKPRKRISGFSAADHLVTMSDATLTWVGRIKHLAGSRYDDGNRETPRAAPRKRK
ncbi:Alpha/beta hydrolase family protein OS=Bosea thiooxidans OX=53254 GN=SAMN05660750_05103 PE=4 SV=1 [Bosea thiooxidans]|uniref:Alpha/beta hydrolase family protein n=1 Tax=Bosea thiooxidans TaxID=53254 RepID=A0A1T5HB56_9HYPH|nr:Alpha/beta hydrolase family protein [Bosea thiooxidans]